MSARKVARGFIYAIIWLVLWWFLLPCVFVEWAFERE